ncbi:hypothetical protein HDU67_008061 [Dinochytrium kinnereticum]|nr:hypothetical protein HDU67_008061 [Dinochytrium kinnereticum]
MADRQRQQRRQATGRRMLLQEATPPPDQEIEDGRPLRPIHVEQEATPPPDQEIEDGRPLQPIHVEAPVASFPLEPDGQTVFDQVAEGRLVAEERAGDADSEAGSDASEVVMEVVGLDMTEAREVMLDPGHLEACLRVMLLFADIIQERMAQDTPAAATVNVHRCTVAGCRGRLFPNAASLRSHRGHHTRRGEDWRSV